MERARENTVERSGAQESHRAGDGLRRLPKKRCGCIATLSRRICRAHLKANREGKWKRGWSRALGAKQRARMLRNLDAAQATKDLVPLAMRDRCYQREIMFQLRAIGGIGRDPRQKVRRLGQIPSGILSWKIQIY